MPTPETKRRANEAYRLRNLEKYARWSLESYYRKRAAIPEAERKTVGRPKVIKADLPKEPKRRGRPPFSIKPPPIDAPPSKAGRPRSAIPIIRRPRPGRPRLDEINIPQAETNIEPELEPEIETVGEIGIND